MHVLFSFTSFPSRHFSLHVPASFPNQISSIYSSVVMLQCRHFPNCLEMPDSVREHLEALKKAGNATPNSCGTKRRDFWSDSALSMGFVDTDAGVQYVPRVADNLSSEMSFHDFEDVAISSTNDIDFSPESNAMGLPRLNFVSPFEPIAASRDSITFKQFVSGSTLVILEDRDLVPDYVFLSLAQLAPCQLIAEDRIGAYRARPIGFTGMCCRYCQGCQPGPGESPRVVFFIPQKRTLMSNKKFLMFRSLSFSSTGFGKFFPNSVRSLAQTTTTQTIIKHLTSKCKHVPRDVKVRLLAMPFLRYATSENFTVVHT
jgi:hypothetical protein